MATCCLAPSEASKRPAATATYRHTAHAAGSRAGLATVTSARAKGRATSSRPLIRSRSGLARSASTGPSETPIPATARIPMKFVSEKTPKAAARGPLAVATASAAAATPSTRSCLVSGSGAPSTSVARASAACSTLAAWGLCAAFRAARRARSARPPSSNAAATSLGVSWRGPFAARGATVPSSHHTPGSGRSARARAGARAAAQSASAYSAGHARWRVDTSHGLGA
mmetsp:Transcript_10536/g.36650  ORF Transcript_10536/g.36650 Transcript_10536/m.36650 type:complete len:227 (+) Transcript_10536:819-1499(+)